MWFIRVLSVTLACWFQSPPLFFHSHFYNLHSLLMADHAELDSHLSRVRPPISKSLKRSASVASLPTPPRTVRKRSRSRGSAYHSSDDDEVDDALPVVSPHFSPSQSHHVLEELGGAPHKRRRIDAVVAELNAEDREDAFWLADAPVEPQVPKPASKTSRFPRSVSKGKPPSSSRRGPPTSTRRLSQSRAVPASSCPTTWSLLSPPPTRPRRPVTPPRKRPVKPMPVRDSPNNPFLVNPADSPGSVPSSPVGPRTPVPDKETIHYVLYVIIPSCWHCRSDILLSLAAASAWPSKILILVLRKTRARRFSPSIRTFPHRRTVPRVASSGLRVGAGHKPKHKARYPLPQGVRHRRHGMMMAMTTILLAGHRARRWHRSSRESAKQKERRVPGQLRFLRKAQKWQK